MTSDNTTPSVIMTLDDFTGVLHHTAPDQPHLAYCGVTLVSPRREITTVEQNESDFCFDCINVADLDTVTP